MVVGSQELVPVSASESGVVSALDGHPPATPNECSLTACDNATCDDVTHIDFLGAWARNIDSMSQVGDGALSSFCAHPLQPHAALSHCLNPWIDISKPCFLLYAADNRGDCLP